MILINDCWENVETLEDVSRIVREYYNRELADELDDLVNAKEFEIEELEKEIEALQDDIDNFC